MAQADTALTATEFAALVDARDLLDHGAFAVYCDTDVVSPDVAATGGHAEITRRAERFPPTAGLVDR